jgi:hypothetical protein
MTGAMLPDYLHLESPSFQSLSTVFFVESFMGLLCSQCWNETLLANGFPCLFTVTGHSRVWEPLLHLRQPGVTRSH